MMEDINEQPVNIKCPLHKSEVIIRVDSSVCAKKHLYCCECVLEDPQTRYMSIELLSLDKFITAASIFYSGARKEISHNSEPPNEYLEILPRQAEAMDKLTKHIDNEKKKIESVFNEITKVVLEKINQKKNEYLILMDEQLSNACQHYSFFEKQLKQNYPKPEDIDSLFPSIEELRKRLASANSFPQLSTLIKGIKEDMNQQNFGVSKEADDVKIKNFKALTESLKAMEPLRPSYEVKNLDIFRAGAMIKEILEKFLSSVLTFKDPIPSVIKVERPAPESKIIEKEDFNIIREWLPDKYKADWDPKLLYRSSRDGLTPQAFHSKCDNQGPTICLVECQFQGALKTSIIGGFLDESWHQGNKYIASEQAFIFSLTSRTKCPILPEMKNYAAYGGETCGLVFGSKFGNDICIGYASNNCRVKPSCYLGAKDIVDLKDYNGAELAFGPIHVEVYKLK